MVRVDEAQKRAETEYERWAEVNVPEALRDAPDTDRWLRKAFRAGALCGVIHAGQVNAAERGGEV